MRVQQGFSNHIRWIEYKVEGLTYMLYILCDRNTHVACSKYGEVERCIQDWWGDLRERDHLKDTVIGGRLMLLWILKKWDRGPGLDLSGSG
jgi:hypothetical protein